MTDVIADALGAVLTRWTIGGGAVPVAPPTWHDALGPDPIEAELRLLALSGQFLGLLTVAQPQGEIQMRDDLPTLSLPPIPEPLRPRTRRVLAQLRDATARRPLLDLLAARGWTLHPADWLPGTAEDVPSVYAAWQDWAADAGTTAETADDWDRMAPAARRAAFIALRRQDSARAGALLATTIGNEPVEMRLKLVNAMAVGLSNTDRPVLESLSSDRAPRVKALAAALLARLGGTVMASEEAGREAAELAGFFHFGTRGLLRRMRVIAPSDIRTAAQANRRAVLMEATTFERFAHALGLSVEALVSAWAWGADQAADRLLAGMAARSAPHAVVAALADGASADPQALVPLLPRLDAVQRRGAVLRLLGAGRVDFVMALPLMGNGGEIDGAFQTPPGAALLAALKTADRPAEGANELLALGLLASRTGAQEALDRLSAAGLIASDPRLDMLRLNVALEHRDVTK